MLYLCYCVFKHVMPCVISSYVTVTYVIEAMAAANALSLSNEWKAKKNKNVQEHRQIADQTLTVCQPVRHVVYYTSRLIMLSW